MRAPTLLPQPQLAGPARRPPARGPAGRPRAPRCVTTAKVRKVNTYDDSWKKARQWDRPYT